MGHPPAPKMDTRPVSRDAPMTHSIEISAGVSPRTQDRRRTMKMNRRQVLLTSVVVLLGLIAVSVATVAAPKTNHHNGQQMLGERIKTNGNHVIHKNGKHTVSAEVKNGKIAGVTVKNDKNENVPVKKYKTTKKMTELMDAANGSQHVSFLSAQDQYIGTVWIGYAFIDEYGNEEIYWFPYDMILDGITGAVDYVPAS